MDASYQVCLGVALDASTVALNLRTVIMSVSVKVGKMTFCAGTAVAAVHSCITIRPGDAVSVRSTVAQRTIVKVGVNYMVWPIVTIDAKRRGPY